MTTLKQRETPQDLLLPVGKSTMEDSQCDQRAGTKKTDDPWGGVGVGGWGGGVYFNCWHSRRAQKWLTGYACQ